MTPWTVALCIAAWFAWPASGLAAPLRIAPFNVDATPPIGAPLCDALVPPAREIVDKLSCRGVVLLGEGKPIVLCVLDWVGIGNGGYDGFRAALAEAAGTTPDRVAVHCTHAHDAPGCDFDAEKLLGEHGLGGAAFDVAHAKQVIAAAAGAIKQSLKQPQQVTHLGLGQARVHDVASNRRVLGPDGKVKWVRWSATRDAEARAQPEGVIDPLVRLISYFDGDQPLLVMSYYATHPQSHYGQGGVSCDFPGLARNSREKELGVPHMHFNGAGGNVTAGKYNDGNPANRAALSQRLAKGMAEAWAATKRQPISAGDVAWHVEPVALPPATFLKEDALLATLSDATKDTRFRVQAARQLAWLRRCGEGKKIDITCLSLGPARVLHMPGELFVEYQLAAQQLRPDGFVAMAAYGDYGMGYIGTEIAYTQGGYETGPASRVAPKVEGVLMDAMKKLMSK
jgi:hypothetical protein